MIKDCIILGIFIGCFVVALIEDLKHPSPQHRNKLRDIE